MSHLGVAALAVAASVLQLGVLPSLFLDPSSAPLLPVAVLAAWGVLRGPSETSVALLLPPIALGAASEERVGWFLLALLPTALVATAIPRGKQPTARRFILLAAVAAMAGAALYTLTLAVASARLDLSATNLEASSGAVFLTALLAACVAALLLPLRRRSRGLFQ